MLLLRLAYRNLARTGIRLWINAAVIAISVVIIVFSRGLYAGLGHEMLTSLTKTEVAGGQLWARGFDPLDSTTFDTGIATVPPKADEQIKKGEACSILYASATLYYEGRVLPVTLRGIEPGQQVLEIPTKKLDTPKNNGAFPCLLGTRMLDTLKLKEGDTFVVKWRDTKGVFDGADFYVVEKMDIVNPRIDSNVVWLSTESLRKMLVAPNKASYIVTKEPKDLTALAAAAAGAAGKDKEEAAGAAGWQTKTRYTLTAWVRQMVRDKERGGRVIFLLLIFLSCVGIFNSQTLAVFKRRKEIGMLIALGLRRRQVITLFTLEGVLTSLLAISLAFTIGAPILHWTATTGILMDHAKGIGVPVPERLRAHYTPELLLITVFIIFAFTTIVSWYPTAKIAKLSPVKALTGRQ